MTPRFRRALAACGAALDRQMARDRARLVGRWALPSGLAIRVVRIESTGLALVGDGRARWAIPASTLTALADAGLLRHLGR